MSWQARSWSPLGCRPAQRPRSRDLNAADRSMLVGDVAMCDPTCVYVFGRDGLLEIPAQGPSARSRPRGAKGNPPHRVQDSPSDQPGSRRWKREATRRLVISPRIHLAFDLAILSPLSGPGDLVVRASRHFGARSAKASLRF